MNRPVEVMVMKDDLDTHLYKKPLGHVIDTYAAYASGELTKGNRDGAEDYLQRLILVLRGNWRDDE